jgi:hypothetical protein
MQDWLLITAPIVAIGYFLTHPNEFNRVHGLVWQAASLSKSAERTGLRPTISQCDAVPWNAR